MPIEHGNDPEPERRPTLEERKREFLERSRPPAPEPAPYKCPECGRRLEYRVGRLGEFLSCTGYYENTAKRERSGKFRHVPACRFAMWLDEQRRPRLPDQVDLLSPAGVPMVKRWGQFGYFLIEDMPRPPKREGGTAGDPQPPFFILNIDKNGDIRFPRPPPPATDIGCEECGALMGLREGKRGPQLRCLKSPRCRGRVDFESLPEAKRTELRHKLNVHLAGVETYLLTRRDGITPVIEGTPIDSLLIPGEIAELPRFEG